MFYDSNNLLGNDIMPMTAKLQEFYDPKRQILHEIVPLDVPFTVQIEASSACDLRCKFCALSSETALKQRNHIMKNMSADTFAFVIEQLKEFPKLFKRVYFCGLGEVLVNPRLPEMVKQIKPNGIAPEIMIFTNAVNLTHDMSLGLIDAGLDIITISVNGLNADDYERNCGRNVDFNKFVEQIAFLYLHKGNMRINIKTVDLCINSETDKQFFFDTFGNICDFINIETIAPIHKGVDYSGDNIKNKENTSKFSSVRTSRRVCAQPFRKLIVSSSGKVNFCDAVYGFPYDDLDIYKQRLVNIWNGPVHRQLLLNQLCEIYDGPSLICEDCPGKHNIAFEEENLDPYVDELYKRISKKENTYD